MKLKLAAFIIFLIAAVFITYPWVFHLTDLVTGYGDNFIYAWIHTGFINAFLNGNILGILNTNIFYPYQIGPSSSDPNLTSALFSLIPYLITKEAIITVSFITIISIIFTGYSIYLLTYYVTKNFMASILSGIIMVFSPAYLSFFAHLQMFFIFFVPMSIMYFFIFLKSQKSKYLVISLIFFLFQTYNNFLGGYFILFSYAVIFFFTFLYKRSSVKKIINKKNAAAFILALALVTPIMLPYFSVSKEFNYKRDIRDTIHFAMQPEDYLYASDLSRIHGFFNNLPINRQSQNNEFKPGYLGLVFSILTIYAIFYSFKKFKKRDLYLNSFLVISLLGLILSLGPFLHLGRQTIHNPFPVPLPYALFYYLIPGFQGFRNSARWEVLFIIAASVLIGLILNKVLKNLNNTKKTVVYLVLILGCILEFNYPWKFVPIIGAKNFPQEHKWLSTTPSNTKYVEMPIYNWNMTDYATIELWRLYYSTIHFRRTVNGGGGFTPPPWQEMVYALDETFPSDEAISKLNKMGLNYIIVHKNEYDRLSKDKFSVNGKMIESGESVINKLNNNSDLKLIKKYNDTYIYGY